VIRFETWRADGEMHTVRARPKNCNFPAVSILTRIRKSEWAAPEASSQQIQDLNMNEK